jgi:hypothetical protein
VPCSSSVPDAVACWLRTVVFGRPANSGCETSRPVSITVTSFPAGGGVTRSAPTAPRHHSKPASGSTRARCGVSSRSGSIACGRNRNPIRVATDVGTRQIPSRRETSVPPGTTAPCPTWISAWSLDRRRIRSTTPGRARSVPTFAGMAAPGQRTTASSASAVVTPTRRIGATYRRIRRATTPFCAASARARQNRRPPPQTRRRSAAPGGAGHGTDGHRDTRAGRRTWPRGRPRSG